MKSVLITGSNRGIGLELVKQLVQSKDAPDHVIATCRKPEEAKELQEIADGFKTISVLKLDITDFTTFDGFAKEVRNIVGSQGLNVLVNNAGTLNGHSGNKPISYIEDLTPDIFTSIYVTNTVGPIILSKTLLPLIREAAENSKVKSYSILRAAIINISSGLGSVSLNTSGSYYGYRESKAALNISSRSLSCDLKDDKILVTCISPGWVRTDMGGPDADISVSESVAGIIKTIYSLNEKHNGALVTYKGKTLPL